MWDERVVRVDFESQSLVLRFTAVETAPPGATDDYTG